MSISIVTPWRDHPELIEAYAQAVAGAQVVIVDNGSAPDNAAELRVMCAQLRFTYLRNDYNATFAESNNQGLARATGDIVLFLNNDIEADAGWLAQVERDVRPGGLYGPALLPRYVDGLPVLYLEGWCIAARRDVWEALEGWDAAAFRGNYYEDNDLCHRALLAGFTLNRRAWPVRHLGNTTSRHTPGAYDWSDRNCALFVERVRAARDRGAKRPDPGDFGRERVLA